MTVEYQKVWTTMNDLEMVTSKICSAREIIDNAVDKIQGSEYDKAELLMTAAYEYLEYYLKEFDEKFKDAWQATVGDLRDGDVRNESFTCDKDDPSPECQGAWNSFWEDVDNWSKEPQQYTEEELNAMCDAAEEKHSKYYYDYDRNDPNRPNPFPQTRWILPVQEAKDVDTDETEYFVSFPQDLLQAAKLKEGDAVHWIDNKDGSFTIRKSLKPLGMDNC